MILVYNNSFYQYIHLMQYAKKSIPFMDKRFLFYTDVTSKVKLSVNKTYMIHLPCHP